MGKQKNTLFIFVLFVMMFIPTFVNAEELEVVAEKVTYYKTIVRENMFNTYSLNSDYDIETVEITEEEYENFNPATAINPSASATVETTYKKMLTSINKNGSYYRYKNVLSWKNFPATRSYDIIGFGFQSKVELSSPLQFRQEYCTATGTCYTLTAHNPSVSLTGAGTAFKLPSGDLSMLTQTVYADMMKSNTSSTITSLYAYGDYSHAQQSVTLSQISSFGVYGSGGIDLPDSVMSKYDAINAATVLWQGTW